VANGDGTAVNVLAWHDRCRVLARKPVLRTKCFVDFEAIDLIETQTAVIEKGADGRDRADAHIFRRYTDSSACDNTGQRLFAMLAANDAEATRVAPAPSTTAELLPPVCTPPNAGRILVKTSRGEGLTWLSS